MALAETRLLIAREKWAYYRVRLMGVAPQGWPSLSLVYVR